MNTRWLNVIKCGRAITASGEYIELLREQEKYFCENKLREESVTVVNKLIAALEARNKLLNEYARLTKILFNENEGDEWKNT